MDLQIYIVRSTINAFRFLFGAAIVNDKKPETMHHSLMFLSSVWF